MSIITIQINHDSPQEYLIKVAEFLGRLAGADEVSFGTLPIYDDCEKEASDSESENKHRVIKHGEIFGDSKPEEAYKQREQDITEEDVFEDVEAPAINPQLQDVELDADNLPWDRRIHARTKTKTSDGKWKLARGVDAKLVKTVIAELKQTMKAPGAMLFTQDKTMPPPPPAAGIPMPPAPPATAAPDTFVTVVQKITRLINEGKLSKDVLVKIVNQVGLPDLTLLGARPDLVPQVSALIDAAVM